MYDKDFTLIVENGIQKVNLYKKNIFGFIISSILAGIYVGFGTLLSFSAASYIVGTDFQVFEKLILGSTFAVALTLVMFAGSELFTGNTMTIATGIIKKKIKYSEGIPLLVVCFLGNLIGSVLVGVLFFLTKPNSSILDYILSIANNKGSISPLALIIKGVLCNMLVCLAVWCASRAKNEVAKLILIFWCILTFVVAGFEHCIANMSLFTIALLNGGNIVPYLYNIALSTIGNILGAVLFVALPYYVISLKKDKGYDKAVELITEYNPKCEQEEKDKELMLQYLKEFKEESFKRESLGAHFTASAIILNKQHDKVLFAYHNIYQSYGWLGGHNDGEFDFLKVAKKEVKEESSLTNFTLISDEIASIECIHVNRHQKNGALVSDHLHLNVTYLFEADENDKISIKPDENSAIKWIKITELAKYVNEADMLDIYNKILKDYL